MNALFRFTVQLVVAAFLASLPRAKAATFADEVARLATPLVDASGLTPTRAVGLVVVVVTDQGTRTFGFGARSAGGVTPPDGDTFFQVGSISKTFTGLLLAAQIESSGGTLLPSTPVNALLAPDLRMPGFGTQQVTVAQLATHYGGLPQFPNNMTGPAFYPAQGYTRAQLATYLSGFTLSAAPGTVYEYSNTGSGLLALALGDRAGLAPYSALLSAQLTGPLGMSDTGLNEAPFTNGITTRLAQGYRSTGTALVPMALSDMGVLEGAGEIISTGNDMAKFLRVLAGLAPFPVAGAVERTVAPRAPGTTGTMTGYGLDIYTLTSGVQQWEKAGLVAGYSAYFAFRRQPGTAVAVLSNRSQHVAAVVPVVREILNLLTPPNLSVAPIAPSSMRVTFPAAARLSYEVQTSPDLSDWTPFTTVTNTAETPATLTFDVPMTPPSKFVRLRY
jgi:serine-type D-Ala-D-Ala carboxypeptidase/endopeptidase